MTALVIGIAAMVMAGAAQAIGYGILNAGSAILGIILAAVLLQVPRAAQRWLAVAAGVGLLATALWGVEVDGIRRWVSAGTIQLQPTFILLPLLLAMYARRHGEPWYAAAVMIAAFAIAVQPDWSMTLPLMFVAFAVWLTAKTGKAAVVLGAALLAFAATWIQADPLEGVTFVEDVIANGWRIGPFHGALVTLGALSMLAPLLTIRRMDAHIRRVLIVFALIWGTLLVASLIGNYPTPLIGYGASPIIGYFLSIIALRMPPPRPTRDAS